MASRTICTYEILYKEAEKGNKKLETKIKNLCWIIDNKDLQIETLQKKLKALEPNGVEKKVKVNLEKRRKFVK